MAITLVVEDGTAKTDSNTYISLADAETYFLGHYYASDWNGATDPNKNIVLAMATRILDQWVTWYGQRATKDQALEWPRYGVVDRDGWQFDSNIVPEFLKRATAELALYLLREDTTVNPETLGFKEISVGSLRLVVDSIDRDKFGALPDAVLVIVEPFGAIRKRGTPMIAKLSRA